MTSKDNKNLLIGVLVVIAVLIILGVFGFGFRNYGMMGYSSSGFMSFSWIFSILIIILIIAGIYWLIKNADHHNRR